MAADFPVGGFARPARPALAGRRILLVEDSPTDRRVLATVLTRAGAEVVLECNGQAAVERIFPRFEPGERFDAVLMDLVMSPLDGGEATAKLRARGFVAPVVIVTASDDPADAARCREAGCDRFLAKSAAHDALLDALEDCLAHADRTRRPAAAS